MLKALREMPQGEAVGPQLVFHCRSVNAGLDARRSGKLVNLQHPVQGGEVYGHDAVCMLWRLNTAHHGASSAVGNRNVAGLGAPTQYRFHFLFVPGEGHHIGRVGKLAIEGPDAVSKAPAVAAHRAVVGISRAELSNRSRWGYAGFTQTKLC